MATDSPTLQLFLELAAIPSPPGEERAVADVVLRYLHDLGLRPDEDACGAEIGSTMGNIYVRLEPTAEGTPLFFCAHLDTVPPSGPLEPVVDDGVVRNAGGTILGADNKSEEVGLLGAYAFDNERLQAQLGYVYDHAGPVGEIILGAPWSQALEVRFHGKAAHSGMYPEEGRSAIQAAAKAIADLRLGRVDDETTANVGVIDGGTAGNIVPEWCTFLAEARSQDERKLNALVQEMLDAFSFAATATDCEVETTMRKSYLGYRFKRDDDVVQLAAHALQRSGYEPSFGLSGGGADANVFNERGRRCVNLANGMVDIHTPDERIAVADLDAMVGVTVALVDAARAA